MYSDEEIKNFMESNREYDWLQQIEIKLAIEDGVSFEDIKHYLEPVYDSSQMFEIRLGIKQGLAEEQIKSYSDPNLKSIYMKAIRYGYVNGLSSEEINLYAKHSEREMKEIARGLFGDKLSIEQIKVLSNNDLNFMQIRALRECYKKGFSIKEVESLVNPDFNYEKIMELSKNIAKKNTRLDYDFTLGM